MARLFAVTRSRGDGWKHALPLEAQDDWKGHAAFMDALYAEGFVLFAGPLEGTADALLIIRAMDAQEIESRLSRDPWTINGLLRTTQTAPWTLRLGLLG